MRPSQTFFGRFASLSPFAILDEQVYRVVSRPPSPKEPFLQSGEQRLAMLPSLTLSQIEDCERTLQREDIFALKRDYLQEALRQEIWSPADIKNSQEALHAVTFIMQEVLPLLIDSRDDLWANLGLKVKAEKGGKQCIEEILARELHGAQHKAGQISPQEVERAKAALLAVLNSKTPALPDTVHHPKAYTPASLFAKLSRNSPLYVMGDKAFFLTASETPLRIHLCGKTYGTELYRSVEKIDTTYREFLLNAYSQEALQEFDEQFRAHLRQAHRRSGSLKDFAKRPAFQYENLGWVRKEDTVYAYWEIPPFAMRNPLRPAVYHPFPATKVGVGINSSRGQIHVGEAEILNAMVHPFLHDWEHPFQKICILSGRDYKNTPYEIVLRISTAINAFTNGLTHESIVRHGAEDESARYFSRPLKDSLGRVGDLSRQEALAKGYIITNEWHIKDGGKT